MGLSMGEYADEQYVGKQRVNWLNRIKRSRLVSRFISRPVRLCVRLCLLGLLMCGLTIALSSCTNLEKYPAQCPTA